jgi:hypothetical protein
MIFFLIWLIEQLQLGVLPSLDHVDLGVKLESVNLGQWMSPSDTALSP